jgi:hypothetical protein
LRPALEVTAGIDAEVMVLDNAVWPGEFGLHTCAARWSEHSDDKARRPWMISNKT